MRDKTEGYLYVATGAKYIAEAERSARSLLDVEGNANICLVTDQQMESAIFENIQLVNFNPSNQSWKVNLIYKIVGIINTPFDRTMFVDTDMYFVDAVEDAFQLLNHFDILACLDYYDQSKVVRNNTVVPYYTPYNTGMLVYRKNEIVESFLHDWKLSYERGIETYWSDQPAFMEALLNHNIKMYILHSSFNFRFLFNVGFLENEKVRIIHGRAAPEELKIISDRVNSTLSQRVWVATLRKCFTWKKTRSQKILRNLYSHFPDNLKRILRFYLN